MGHVRSVPTIAVALALVAFSVSTVSAQQADSDGEQAMLDRLNALRTEAGLSALSRDARLDAAARTHSVDMAWHQMLEHVSPRTGSPADRVSAAGVEASGLAENVAFNQSAAEAQEGLEGSAPHKQNMMAAGMTHVGLSVVYADGGVYATQVFASIGGGDDDEAAPPAAAPAPPPPAAGPPPAPAPPPPAAGAVQQQPLPPAGAPVAVPNGRRVAGYWVQHAGRWYYYPMPPNAQPGQRLQPDLSVTGGPPAHLLQQHQQGGRIRVVAPPPPPPARRVYVRPPAAPPVYRWRVRL